jgi:PAS domain S-box-containing protein
VLRIYRQSLLVRAIAPIAALFAGLALVAMLGLAYVNTSAAKDALGERAQMMTSVLSGGASEALWNMDPTAADALLAALASDTDYLGSTIYATDRTVFARHGRQERYGPDDVVKIAPIMRTEDGRTTEIGAIEVHLSPQRLYGDIRSITTVIAAICIVSLLVVCGVLVLILRGVTRPIVRMTDVMTELASGRTEIDVPARDREDELGRMAAAVQTFRLNAIAKDQLEAEQIRMREEAERERRAAEATLRQSEERFRALIEHSNDMVAVLRPDGVSTYQSPPWIAGSGRTAEEISRVSLFDLLHPDDVEAVKAAFADLLVKPGSQASGRSRVRHADGTWRYLAWSARNALEIGGVNGVIMNARDMTSELALEEQLQQARKMEAIGQLAGGIAHDFNNIMGAILGFADFLLQDLPEDSPQHGFAQRIVSAGRRARDLVQQILAFARKSSVERLQSDLVPIVRETHDLLRASLPSSTELKVETTSEALVAEVNPTQISQVVVNLCVNASDSLLGQPGRVTVGITRVRPGDSDFAAFARGGGQAGDGIVVTGRLDPCRGYARITVADTGSGMAPDVLPRIFDPFFTTKQRGRGTGLGLARVHGIVAEYGGACVVESKPGHGTIFRIYLPLVAHPAIPAVAGDEARGLAGEERLLVVDDETFLTEMLQIGFGRLGYRVTTVNDPSEALRLFETDPSAFDAVISDQVMPKMTGLALLQRLKAIRPAVPFILCTGFSDGASEDTALAAGAGALFIKPVSPEQIAAKLRELADAA